MLCSARFALLVGLSASLPILVALDPPQKQNQNKQQAKEETTKKAEAAKKNAPRDNSGDARLDRRNNRMKERNREIDGLLNKQKQ